jgi:dTDP-4-amino-4,6-dideoxygalactose transaminase
MTTTLAAPTSLSPIPFTRPSTGAKEQAYIAEALRGGKLSGDGPFTSRCQKLLQERFGFPRVLLTTSCTDALELSALLLDIRPGDEVIVPSYTFVSTANAFALRGARIVFADSRPDHPNLDADTVEALVTPRTKAIVAVHYAGAACDMDALLAIGARHGVKIVEDAAQAIDSTWKGRPLGSIGAFAAFSFHETKNISCGEGGAIVINDKDSEGRAEIMREKGTNRSAFFRGEVNKYGWVDLGSSFLPSDILAAYLLGQLESMDDIQRRRLALWNRYHQNLEPMLSSLGLQPQIVPAGASNNAHMYYVLFESLGARTRAHEAMREAKVGASFHYLSLHSSAYFAPLHDGRPLPNADRYSDCLLRLPLFGDMTAEQVDRVCEVLVSAIRS